MLDFAWQYPEEFTQIWNQVLEARWMGWSPWKSHRFWIDCLTSLRAIGPTSEFWWRKFALRDSIKQVSGLNMADHMKWTWAHDGLWCILAYGWVIWGNPCRQMMGRWDNQASKAVHRVWKTEVPCLASPQELWKVSRWFVFHQGPVMTFVNLFSILFRKHYDSLWWNIPNAWNRISSKPLVLM